MQNQIISELYIDDNRPEHSRNPTDILKSEKISMRNLIPKR